MHSRTHKNAYISFLTEIQYYVLFCKLLLLPCNNICYSEYFILMYLCTAFKNSYIFYRLIRHILCNDSSHNEPLVCNFFKSTWQLKYSCISTVPFCSWVKFSYARGLKFNSRVRQQGHFQFQ